jgi:hypothetical protein
MGCAPTNPASCASLSYQQGSALYFGAGSLDDEGFFHAPSYVAVDRRRLYSRRVKFKAILELGGKTATGIEVPAEVVEALGAGRRPPVSVTIGKHTYRSTVAVMDGRYMLPVNAENREAAGIKAGDEIDVEVELNTAPREVNIPADFAQALDAEPSALQFFEGLSNSLQRYWVDIVQGAKAEETRRRRIEGAIAKFREGKPR